MATHNHVVLVMVCIVETRLTVVLDLVHILAFQTLKFCKSLRQTNSTTLYNTFMCFSKERDYLVLSRTYSCTTTDSIGVENCKVLEHYSSIYDAREVTDCVCVCVCVCAACLFFSVLLLTWQINMFIVDSKREHIFMHTAYVCYRYAILGWRSGSNMQQPRQLIKNDVEQLLIWLPKCTKILVCLELPNTMFMVSASFCGHCYRKRNRSNMVIIFCICSKQFQQIKTTMHDDETLKQTTQSTSASPITFCFTAIM